jgi:ABC-2 type transport system ATP-binding protein
MSTVLSVRGLTVQYGRRRVLDDVSFEIGAGQALGVIGANGAGKSTLLRTLVGCIAPQGGEVRVNGLRPRDALRSIGVAYFAGDSTLPGFVRASVWGTLGTGESVLTDRRPMRALSRGTRQLLGLRTVLGRHPLGLVVLDEPWEGLDADAARWLNATLEAKRDRGAAVVLSSHRLHDLAGFCDAYLFLITHRVAVLRAPEIARVGPVTPALLLDVFDRLRGGRDETRPIDRLIAP